MHEIFWKIIKGHLCGIKPHCVCITNMFEHPNPFSPDMALQGSFYFVVCNLIQSIW